VWSAISGSSLLLACSEFTAPESTTVGSTPTPDADQTFDTDASADSGKPSSDVNIAPGGECVNSADNFCDDFNRESGFSGWSEGCSVLDGCTFVKADSGASTNRAIQFTAKSSGFSTRAYRAFEAKSVKLSAQIYLSAVPQGKFDVLFVEYRGESGDCDDTNCRTVVLELQTSDTGTSINITESGQGVSPGKSLSNWYKLTREQWYTLELSVYANSDQAVLSVGGVKVGTLDLVRISGVQAAAVVGVVRHSGASGSTPCTVLVDDVKIVSTTKN
jgi:hypothetical protein